MSENNYDPDTASLRDFAWAMRHLLDGAMVRHPLWYERRYWAINDSGDIVVHHNGQETQESALGEYVTHTGFELYEPHPPKTIRAAKPVEILRFSTPEDLDALRSELVQLIEGEFKALSNRIYEVSNQNTLRGELSDAVIAHNSRTRNR